MRKTILTLALIFPSAAWAQKHELGLTLGGLTSRSFDRGPNVSGGTALQANYGYRLLGGDKAALYGEVHFLANPQRTVDGAGPTASRDVATLYVTPGVRVKFLPKSPVAPYFAIGGGYAMHEHSTLNAGGQPNAASRTSSTGAFDFGGGVDVKFWRWLGLRAEIRDFYTGQPAYVVRASGRQHNVVAGGGFVIKWGE